MVEFTIDEEEEDSDEIKIFSTSLLESKTSSLGD